MWPKFLPFLLLASQKDYLFAFYSHDKTLISAGDQVDYSTVLALDMLCMNYHEHHRCVI